MVHIEVDSEPDAGYGIGIGCSDRRIGFCRCCVTMSCSGQRRLDFEPGGYQAHPESLQGQGRCFSRLRPMLALFRVIE